MVKKRYTNNLKKNTTSSRLFYSLLFFLILFLFLFTRGISLPFVGYNAWNFNIYSLIAHNYNTFGVLATKFAPVISISQTLPSKPEYYLHHPPLISLAEALSFQLFGESFISARVTVLFFTIGSLLLLYLIGREIWGKRVGVYSVILATIIPASILFGRMIGQEPLVLFFVLLTIYFLQLYWRLQKKRYLLLCLISILFGVLSDWPIIYFVFSLLPWFIQKRKIKQYIFLTTFSVLLGVLYLTYIYWIMGGFSDILHAIQVRSLGMLTTLHYWPIKWVTAIILRIFVYFNPAIILVLLLTIFTKHKYITTNIQHYSLIVSLALFGVVHIVLYPEGSFGHPYWIYYLLPSIVFSSALLMEYFYKKNYFIVLILLTLFSVAYLLKIESWKTKEIQGNLWRYEMAKHISIYTPKYSFLAMNPESPIDADILQYQFSRHADIVSTEKVLDGSLKYQYYIYVCQINCNSSIIYSFQKKYKYEKVITNTGVIYIFNLNLLSHKNFTGEQSVRTVSKEIPLLANNMSFQKHIYNWLIHAIGMPQL